MASNNNKNMPQKSNNLKSKIVCFESYSKSKSDRLKPYSLQTSAFQQKVLSKDYKLTQIDQNKN